LIFRPHIRGPGYRELVANIKYIELAPFPFGPPLISLTERSQRNLGPLFRGDHVLFRSAKVAHRGENVDFNLAPGVVEVWFRFVSVAADP
jgi:hypothetical protein